MFASLKLSLFTMHFCYSNRLINSLKVIELFYFTDGSALNSPSLHEKKKLNSQDLCIATTRASFTQHKVQSSIKNTLPPPPSHSVTRCSLLSPSPLTGYPFANHPPEHTHAGVMIHVQECHLVILLAENEEKLKITPQNCYHPSLRTNATGMSPLYLNVPPRSITTDAQDELGKLRHDTTWLRNVLGSNYFTSSKFDSKRLVIQKDKG